MSKYADFLVQGDPESVRALGDRIVRDAGFTIVWDASGTGRARRGNVPLTLLLGMLAGKDRQAMKVNLTIFAGPEPGTTVVRLTRASTGWAAGAIGASRNKKMFVGLIDDLATPFGRAGTLLGVIQG